MSAETGIVQAEEMSAMGPECRARPPASCKMVDDLQKPRNAVAMNGIEEKDVAIAAKATVTIEQRQLCASRQ